VTLLLPVGLNRSLARWNEAKRLYIGEGVNARFKLYPGIAHSVSSEMQQDIEAFFLAAMTVSK
jgi:predicted esterase